MILTSGICTLFLVTLVSIQDFCRYQGFWFAQGLCHTREDAWYVGDCILCPYD